MKTFYILYPGLHGPVNFEPKVAPILLTQQDLWQASRSAPPSLLFRVRTESDHGSRFGEYDRLESCVGMVDSVTRWRGVFRHAFGVLNAIHNSQLNAACSSALNMVASQHPSSISMAARRQLAEGIIKAAEGAEQPFEHLVARGIAALVMADNDVEAAAVVPFAEAFMPYRSGEQPEEFKSRLATIETMVGAMLLTEAATRLAERIPAWLHAAMPEPLSTSQPVTGPRSDVSPADQSGEKRAAASDDDDDDKPDGL